ncbi:MAG: hypothetical protein K9L28_06540 [Synergistales bacterium]|nr:hypothetical protein [Synergistales bacterium]
MGALLGRDCGGLLSLDGGHRSAGLWGRRVDCGGGHIRRGNPPAPRRPAAVGDADTDACAHGYTNSSAYGDASTCPHRDASANRNTDADPGTYADTDGCSHRNANTNGYPDTGTYRNADTGAHTYPRTANPDACSCPHSYPCADANPGTNRDASTCPHRDTGTHADTDTCAYADAGPDAHGNADTQSGRSPEGPAEARGQAGGGQGRCLHRGG